jgi:cAMP-dependent protein kinase regulator
LLKYKFANADKEEDVNSGSENDEDENQDDVDLQILARKNKAQGGNQRASVSAECYGVFNEKKAFVAKVIPKGAEQMKKIYEKVIQSFLFNSLEEKDLKTVIDAMEEVIFKQGDQVIKQGDPGDVLYVVYSGELDCFKTFVIDFN